MSNRVLGFLIILILILFSIAFFMYAFLYNNAKIIINSNISEYSAEIYNKKTLKKYNFECKQKKCFLEKIPPFTYKLTISKKGYKQIIEKIILPRNETININIKLDKKVKLEEIIEEKEDKPTESLNPLKNKYLNNKNNSEKIENKILEKSEKKLTNKERIQELISKKNKIKNSLKKVEDKIKLENTNNKKYLFLKKINLFKNSNFSKISVLETYGDKNIFLIEFHKKKYIYNKNTSNLEEINLKIPVIYLKKNGNSEIDLITEKGIFTYSFENKSLKYFSLFQDYINYKGNYIGVISAKDSIRKNNFGYNKENKNLIVLYNKKDFSKKIIYKTNYKIKKIINNDNKIIIYNLDNKKFKLSNF